MDVGVSGGNATDEEPDCEADLILDLTDSRKRVFSVSIMCFRVRASE